MKCSGIIIPILLVTVHQGVWLMLIEAKEIPRDLNSFSNSSGFNSSGSYANANPNSNANASLFRGNSTSGNSPSAYYYNALTGENKNEKENATESTHSSKRAIAGDDVDDKIREELEFSSSTKYSQLKFGMKVSELHKQFPKEELEPSFPAEDPELKFFQQIQGLNLDWQDILGSYRNVSAEVETVLCKSRCKTTVALWVLQNLNPCDSIEKRDCPAGLLCCVVDSEDKSSLRKPNDQNFHDEEHYEDLTPSPGMFVPFTLYNDDGTEQDIYPEPILDPIPNDES